MCPLNAVSLNIVVFDMKTKKRIGENVQPNGTLGLTENHLEGKLPRQTLSKSYASLSMKTYFEELRSIFHMVARGVYNKNNY